MQNTLLSHRKNGFEVNFCKMKGRIDLDTLGRSITNHKMTILGYVIKMLLNVHGKIFGLVGTQQVYQRPR